MQALASAPLDTEAARAFLQRRIAFFAKVFVILTASFQVMARIARLRAQGELEQAMGARLIWVQLLLLGCLLVVYLRARSGTRSLSELRALDAVIALAPPLIMPYALNGATPQMRPELLLLLAVAHGMMARAVIVPSTALRTLTLSAVICVSSAVWTARYYAGRSEPGLAPFWLYMMTSVAWAVASTGVSTVISYTIFGLRQRIVEATQIGQYTLERKIGQGGMGVVYRAHHALLRRPTAIKLLASPHTDQHDLLRFEREVQLTSQLTHPNTIAIYDYGRTPDGVFYYAMELLDGLDLHQLVECSGPQSPSCVVRVLQQIAGALSEAHGQGLIHRDIKPANVILCERGGTPGVVKVVDFGLVKSLRSGADVALSGVQTVLGTPLYISPEAITQPDTIDARSDLYAVGALAYFLLTGQPLFPGHTLVEICGHHLYTQPTPPSERTERAIPADLEALVLQLLAKDRALRPASARELLKLLAALDVPALSDAELDAWWRDVREQQAKAAALSGRQSTSASAQTVAVDLRSRRLRA